MYYCLSCKTLHDERPPHANGVKFKTGFITLERGEKYSVGICAPRRERAADGERDAPCQTGQEELHPSR